MSNGTDNFWKYFSRTQNVKKKMISFYEIDIFF